MAALRILLVDDEAALLKLFQRHLERAGHSVDACHSAESALESLPALKGHPELLITDQTLPGLSGTDLAAVLLDRFPQLLCIVCSGFPMSLDSLPAALRPRAAILQKPFLPAMLERSIEGLLAANPRAGGTAGF